MFSGDVQVFSPHLLNNFYGLEKLMKGEEAISKVEVLSKDPEFIKLPTKTTPYFNRWQIVWIGIIKYPFAIITSVFFKALSVVLDYLHLQKGSRFFSVLSKQMVRDWEQLSDQFELDAHILIPAYNAHQLSSWDLYGHGSIPTSLIKDCDVLPLTFHSAALKNGVKQAMNVFYQSLEKEKNTSLSKSEKRQTTQEFEGLYTTQTQEEALTFLRNKYPGAENGIHKLYDALKQVETQLVQNYDAVSLFSDKGLSRGASLWFINLYLKTKEKFENPVKHLLAVAQQFKTGVPRQGALLQGFENSEPLLKLKKTDLKQLHVSLYELDCDRTSALKKIEALETGIYRLGVRRDSLVYIKLSETKGFVWNPSYGLFATTGKQLLETILKYNHKPGDRDSHIYFARFENKTG